MDLKQKALDFHAGDKPGKIEIALTKDMSTSSQLSLAYSPGVAYPCLAIQEDPSNAYKYTSKGNMVAIISNGTAVLGLGDIGHLASKPVMEGKAGLLKTFANIDSIDIEVNEKDPNKLAEIVYKISDTFGGINLEDIKAPECFIVEKIAQENSKIPIFHDDQHGTAIVTLAGIINYLKLTNKTKESVKVVFNGAGAAAIACRNLLVSHGIKASNIIMCDTSGVIYKGRQSGMNEYKEACATDTEARTLQDATIGCDILIGLSVKGAFSKQMIQNLNENPAIFGMANPDPEITPQEVLEIRQDAFIATGRSDYPNQINNVLAFPYVFRGALDIRAKRISENMKVAAANAIAELATLEVTEDVKKAYNNQDFKFGKNYIVPKPFDKRLFSAVSFAVAEAGLKDKLNQIDINLNEYKNKLSSI